MKQLQLSALVAFIALGIIYLMKNRNLRLKYFTRKEFGVWWPLMNPELLKKFDEFREVLGVPVYVSQLDGGLGRPSSPNSQHFPSPLVNAIDGNTNATFEQIYAAARQVGFTGIGLYPNWRTRNGFHLDLRASRTAEDPALWSAFNAIDGTASRGGNVSHGQEYVAIEQALSQDVQWT